MIKKKLIKNALKVDKFIINYLKKQKKSLLIKPMKYGVISGGKKIRSTIIFDFGKIFNLSESCTLSDVKTVYKRLAKLKHPDRLAGLKIPEKYISLANHNFSNLQDAYKILTNFKKKDHSTKNQQG